jgi:stage II sporulation protein AA (anti-sigma F factor antagonist)
MTEQEQPPRKESLGDTGSNELASVSAAEHAGGALVVTITGELDISNIDAVADVIYAQPNSEDGLVIDLSEVRYLDSSAVSLLHDLARRLRSRAQRLVVVSPAGTPPRRILELTALYLNAPIADLLEEALRQVGSSGPP